MSEVQLGKIYCLHGFLGEPSDWGFLEGPVVAPVLFGESVLPFEEWATAFNSGVDVNENNTLVGYSLGGRLALQWSPVQISGWLKLQEGIKKVSHEAIYRYIWSDNRQGGSLYKELRYSGKKYNKRSKGSAGRGCIPNRIDIDQRPPIVEDKTRLGDWELDLIIGK